MTVGNEEDEQQNPKNNSPSSSSSSQTKEDLIPTFPSEIIVDILLRLPVESLLRCRSVCKAWISLISDPIFVKSHLNLSVRSHNHAQHRLIYSYYNPFEKPTLKCCSLFNLLCDKSVDAVELDCPLKVPYVASWVVGSCNGLICVTNEKNILYIWNPATRRSDRLPDCGMKRISGCNFVYGFGYLESNDDFKVVGLFSMRKHGGVYSTKVFSMKTGNWKMIDEFPGAPLDDSNRKYLHGTLNWLARHDFGSSYAWRIVSLDLAKETYDEVPLPVYCKNGFDLTLGVLGDWLSVMCNFCGSHEDVWVMKEYGVKESWMKLVSIPYLTDPGIDRYWVPLCISNDGKFLLKLRCKMCLYDPKDEHISEIQNMDDYLVGCTYVESLVIPFLARGWR